MWGVCYKIAFSFHFCFFLCDFLVNKWRSLLSGSSSFANLTHCIFYGNPSSRTRWIDSRLLRRPSIGGIGGRSVCLGPGFIWTRFPTRGGGLVDSYGLWTWRLFIEQSILLFSIFLLLGWVSGPVGLCEIGFKVSKHIKTLSHIFRFPTMDDLSFIINNQSK